MIVKTRFAPSPTGYLHFGNIRTALISYMLAKSKNGEFILRIDDTDYKRSTQEYIQALIEDMNWLGLDYQQIIQQSKRYDLYSTYTERLIKSGRLYACYETKEELEYKKKIQLSQGRPPIYDRFMLNITESERKQYEAKGIKPYYRFKLNHEIIEWEDIFKGHVKFDCSKFSDPVLIKDNGMYLYSLCSVVDDINSGVSCIVRGEDHMANTVIHLQLFDFFKAKHPSFGHMSMIEMLGGQSFSKREGSLSVRDLKNIGIHPLAILNYLFFLGQAETDVIYLSLSDLVKQFNTGLYSSKSVVKFSIEKLKQININLLQKLDFHSVHPLLKGLNLGHITKLVWDFYKFNINSLSEISKGHDILYGDLKINNDFNINKKAIKLALDALPVDNSNIDKFNLWMTATHETDSTMEASTDPTLAIQKWLSWVKLRAKTNLGLTTKDFMLSLRLAISGSSKGPLIKDLLYNIPLETIKKRLQDNLSNIEPETADI